MNKVFKVHSVQSENLSTTQNLLDFDMPEGEMLDLSKSYVSINARVEGSSADAGWANCIFNVQGAIGVGVAGANPERYCQSSRLVKNARLTSDRVGKIEELRDVNVIKPYLSTAAESQSKFLGNSYHNMMSIREYEDYGSTSPLIDVSSEEIDAGRYVDKSVRIPLSQILNVGEVSMFDTARLGRCRLNLELDMSRVSARGDQYNNTYFTTNNNGQVIDESVAGGLQFLTLGVGATPKKYDADFQQRIPWYVDMPVVVESGTVDGVDISGTKSRITRIQYTATTGAILLTVVPALATIAGAGSVNIKLRPADNTEITTKSITLGQAELVLHAVGDDNMPSQRPDAITFSEYTLERDNGNGLANFKRQYEMEPNAVNTIVLPKETGTLVATDIYETTRISVDNMLMTDRDVAVHTPLYYDALSKFYLNQGKSVENTTDKDYRRNLAPNGDTNQDRGGMTSLNSISSPLPITGNMKLVEFEIVRAAGVNELNIYKQVIKTV
jgi:hypothetical protein